MKLQKLVNRAIHLYLEDENFKKQVEESVPVVNNSKY